MKPVKILGLVAAISIMVNFAVAQTWTQIGASIPNWLSIASSANGTKLIAIESTDLSQGIGSFPPFANYPANLIYSSTNSGASWTQTGAPTNNWGFITSSADGTKLVSGASGASGIGVSTGGIFVSTNSGDTWIQSNASTNNWNSIASSADGNRLIAGAYGDGDSVYLSTNAGMTWMPTGSPLTNSLGYSNYWVSVASSASGQVLAAAAGNWEPGAICISTNSGATWSETSAPISNWRTVALSANGSELIAGQEYPGLVYISTNYGITWTATSTPTSTWNSLAASADGSKLIAACPSINVVGGVSPGAIYTSTNFGVDWVSNNVPNNVLYFNWEFVGSSADGNKIFAVDNYGEIWTSQTTPSPQLNLTTSKTNLALSWTIPSTNFVLQQSADLVSWADVTNPPVLNLTNLQNQVTLTPSNSSDFYRLSTP